jgi:hypothetical protein
MWVKDEKVAEALLKLDNLKYAEFDIGEQRAIEVAMCEDLSEAFHKMSTHNHFIQFNHRSSRFLVDVLNAHRANLLRDGEEARLNSIQVRKQQRDEQPDMQDMQDPDEA